MRKLYLDIGKLCMDCVRNFALAIFIVAYHCLLVGDFVV